jgi:hypothetical protein
MKRAFNFKLEGTQTEIFENVSFFEHMHSKFVLCKTVNNVLKKIYK